MGKKKISIFIITFVILVMNALICYAADEVKIEVEKTELHPGDEFTVSVGLNSTETSLYAYTAKLSYDKDVFDVIKEDNFEEKENWSDISYNSQNNKFALINKSGELTNQFLNIKFKIKQDAKPGNTNITVNSASASNGTNKISLIGSTKTVSVIKDGLKEGESLPVIEESKEEKEEDISKEVKKEFPWIGFILIVVCIVLAFILTRIILFSAMNKKGKAVVSTILIALIVILLIIAFKNIFKKDTDVNKDGKVTYEDTNELVEYILDIRKQGNNDLTILDVNKDGKVDINDVGTTVKDAKDEEYKVDIDKSSKTSSSKNSTSSSSSNKSSNSNSKKLSNNKENKDDVKYNSKVSDVDINNYTPKKGAKITLDLFINVTPYTKVKEVKIAGKYYKVSRINAIDNPVKVAALETMNIAAENNHYQVTIVAPNKAGVQDIVVTDVKLDNNVEVKTNYKVKIDVLKDKPEVKDFKINDKKSVPEISFNFEDPDGALKNGKFVIKDEDGNIVFESNKIEKGQNTFKAELVDGKTYHYDFEVDYDLDHNYFSKAEADDFLTREDFIDELFTGSNGNLEFTAKYGFTNKDMKLKSEVSSDDELVLSFENGEDSYYDVKSVVIDGVEYEVEKKDGKYVVKVENKGIKGQNNSLTVDQVKLQNGYVENVNKKLNYFYLKDAPTVKDFNAFLEENILHISMDTVDEDEAITRVLIKVKDKSGKVIKTETLEKNENGNYSKDINLDASGTYTLEAEIYYDVGNGESKLTQKYDKEIKTPIIAKFVKEECKVKEYVKRNELVEVTYKIYDNTDEDVKYIIVNSVKLEAEKLDNDTYKVKFNVPKERTENGIFNIKATAICYEEEEVQDTIELSCEILKSELSIEDLLVDDSEYKESKNIKLHFEVKDEEDTFLSGTIVITDIDTGSKREINITEDEDGNVVQTYEIGGLEKFTTYAISINAKYDLDNDRENGKNENSKTFINHEFIIEGEYDLKISDLNYEITDDGKLKITFTSSNDSKHSIEEVEVGFNGTKHEYKVNKNENTYIVEIPLEEFGKERTVVTLEEIILDNLKPFNRENNNELFENLKSIVIFKNKPTAEINEVTVNEEQSEIKVKGISITDDDNTISKKYAVLKLNGEVVDKIELTDSTEVTFTSKENEIFKAGKYEVEILASYDTVDGKIHNEEKISEEKKEVEVNIVASITSASEKIYAEKGSSVEISFNIKSNTDKEITDIKLNTDKVNFRKGENGNYIVSVIAKEQSGLNSYKVTEVRYDTTVKIENSKEALVYVLKDVPTISDTKFDDINDPHSYTFTFNDTENTLIGEAYVNINYKNGASSNKETIQVNKSNKIDLPNLTDNNPATLSFEGTYDRDDDTSNGVNQYEISKLFEDIELKVIKYEISINNIEVKEVNQEENTVTITFEAENDTEYDISEVKYGDNFYNVTKNGDKYEVTIPYYRVDENKVELSIEKVKVSNGKVVDLLKPVKFTILKKVPSAKFKSAVKENENIKATFEITDEDETIPVGGIVKAELRNENGNVVDYKFITKNEKEVTFENVKAGNYNINLIADYDVIDGEEHKDVVLATSEKVVVPIIAKIEKSQFKKYPNKNENMTVTYTIKTNTDKEITDLYVNNVKEEAIELDDDIYSIQYTAPSVNGKAEIRANKVYFDEEEVNIDEKNDEIDVLRARPYYLNEKEDDFEIIENYDDKTVTVKFTVKDPDGATLVGKENDGYVTFGYGKFKDKNDNGKPTYKIGEKSEITFTNVEEGVYMLHIYAPSFDLDSDKTDKFNHYENAEDGGRTIIRCVAFLKKPSEVNLHNIFVKTDNKEKTRYLNKNEKFKITFEADTILANADVTTSECYPEYIRIKDENKTEEERTYKVAKSGNKYVTEESFEGYAEKGIKEIEIESVILNNKEVIPMKNEILKIDVLKEIPEILDFKVDTESEVPKATFNLNDKDSAVVGGKIIVKDKDKGKIIKEIELTEADGKIVDEYDLDLDLFEQYELTLQIKYDLDSNTIAGNENDGTLEKVIDNVEITRPYNLQIKDLKLKEVDEINGKIILEFISTNASKHHISSVKLEDSDESFDVVYDEESNKYTLELLYTGGEREIVTIKEVTLDNERQDIVTLEEKASIVIFKDAPKAQSVTATYASQEKSINVGFTIKDNDNTVSKAYAKLISPNGEETVNEVTLKGKVGETKFDNIEKAGTYKVEILADFDRADGKEHIKEELEKENNISDEVVVDIKVNSITTKKLSNKFPEKDEILEITYDIEDNTDEKITAIEYESSHITNTVEEIDGNYKAVLGKEFTSSSGVRTLEVKRIHYGEKIVDVTHNGDKIDILKSKIKFNEETFKSVEDLAKSNIAFSFEIINPDNATLNGTATVGENVQEFSNDKNTLLFNVEKNKQLELIINIKYDRDTNQLEEDKENHIETLTVKKEFSLIEDVKFDLDNIFTSKFDPATGIETKTQYFNKGEGFRVGFKPITNLELKVTHATINGTKYEVTERENEEELGNLDGYYVQVNAPDNEKGVKELAIESVTLSDGRDITFENKKIQYEILKDKPKINSFNISNDGTKATITLDVSDPDEALTDKARVIITDETEDEENKVKFNQKFTSGLNTFEFTANLNKEYLVKVINGYDLDSNKLNKDDENLNEHEDEYTKQSLMIGDRAKFAAVHVSIPSIVTDKDENVVLTFENAYQSIYDVEEATINGKPYTVEKENNVYKVVLKKNEQKGDHIIKFESVKLSNDFTFDVNRNLKYLYENEKPVAENIKIEEHRTENKVKVTFELKDKDNATQKLYARLLNSTDTTLEEVPIENNATEAEFSLPKAYKYSVDIVVDYDKGNGTSYKNIVIGNNVHEVGPVVTIESCNPESKFVQKNGEVNLVYKINTNIDEDVRLFRINGSTYDVDRIDDNTYKVLYDKIGDQGGTLDLEVQQIKFTKTMYELKPVYKSSVEVLKNKPEVSYLEAEKNENEKIDISLKMIDDDSSITDKNVDIKILDSNNSEVYKEDKINLDENGIYNKTIENLQFDTEYKVEVFADYDLDGSVSGNNNEHTDMKLSEKSFNVTNNVNYNFKFDNFSPEYEWIGAIAYPGSPLSLKFTSTNDSEYKVQSIVLNGEGYNVKLNNEKTGEYLITDFIPKDKYGIHTVKAEKVILSNGKSFDISENNESVEYEVIGDYAKAIVLSMEEDTERGKLHITFKIKDDYDAIKEGKKVKISIYSSDAKEPYDSVEVNEDDTEVDLNTPLTAKYIIKFTADSEISKLMPILNEENKLLTTQELEASQSTVITEVTPDTYYPAKGSIFGVNYKILTLSDKKVIALTINGERCAADDNGNNIYKSYVAANNEAGLMKFETSTVEFEDGSTDEFKASGEVEVIKEVPTITDFERVDNIEGKSTKLTFNVEDTDNLIRDGGKFQGSINGKKIDLKVGQNTMEFNDLIPNTNIAFNITGTYDLDTDMFNNKVDKDQNNYVNNNIFTVQFLFSDNNGLYKVTGLEAQKDNKKNTYFEKDDEVRLKFNFMWVDDTYVEKAKVNGKTYDVYKNEDDYIVVLDKFTETGKHDLKLESIKLSNGKEIPLENYVVSIETLKDKPTMSKLTYDDTENEVSLNITISDEDKAIKTNEKLNIEVLNEKNKNVYTGDLEVGENTVKFSKDESDRYSIKIKASYDRDSNEIEQNKNEVEDDVIVSENININERKYELKDIKDITVYEFKEDGSVGKADTIKISKIDSNIENYLVKVDMESLPTYYGKIEDYKQDNGKLVLILNGENIITYNGESANEKCEVVYGSVDGDTATKENQYSANNNNVKDNIYIPDYDRIKTLGEFTEEKLTLYHNLNKLMPFFDAKYLVRDGEKFDKNHKLNQKTIKDVIAVDKNGNAQIVVTTDNYKDITSIKVIFSDDELENYDVKFNEFHNGITSYIIPELGIEYNYNNYVMKADARVIKTLKDSISKFNYVTDLDVLTKDSDSRIYREYYDDTVSKTELDDFITKVLISQNINVVTENDVYNELIKDKLPKETTLMRWIYAYNYIHRWYSFDIDGLKMSDVLMFKGNLLNKPSTIDDISNDVISGNIATDKTGDFYKDKIAKYTGQNTVFAFIKYYVSKYAKDKNIDTWYRDNVPGVVVEAECTNKKVEYSLWHNLSINEGKYSKYILVLLTLPDDAAYIISNPTSILFGSQRTYVQNPKDPVQRAKLQALAEGFGVNVSKFFSTISTFASIDSMNKMSTVHMDTLFTYVDDGTNSRKVQKALTTQEPFHKNFCEVLNDWTILKGAGAYSGGGSVYFVYEDALRAYSVWTHENAHLGAFQGLLWGITRGGILNEDMPDGNITQGSGDGGINFNLTYDYDKNALVTTNLTTERIDTPDKMKDFYSKLVDTNDFLDYVEAKAFLKLSADEQSKLCLQVSYPNGSDATGGSTTKVEKISKEAIENMHLNDVHDLWTNKLLMMPGVSSRSFSPSLYGGDSIYTRHWYQPHNDTGRPDSYSLKWLAFELIATGGYDKGYRYWYGSNGGTIKNDLEALRAITNDKDITFEKYKQDRYAKMEANWKNMKFFDADKVVDEYVEALKKDATENNNSLTNSTAVKRKYYYMIKQGTDDFNKEVFNYAPEKIELEQNVSKAEEFINLCRLKPNSTIYLESDIDLSEYSTGSAIVTNSFTGTIEGRNHKITGLKVPLFASLSGATVKNLEIENPTVIVKASEVGSLAKTITGTTLNDIVVRNALMSSKNNRHIGSLVGSAYKSEIKDCHAENVNVFGANRSGTLIGYIENTTVEECSGNGVVTVTGNASGVFIGQANYSTIKNCYAIGSISAATKVDYIGGLSGWIENSTIHNNIVKASIYTGNGNAGVFSGTIRDKFDVQNNVAIANGFSDSVIGLFDNNASAGSINGSETFKNNYEIANGHNGKTSSSRGIHDNKVKAMEITGLTKEFIKETLGWDEEIWNLDTLVSGELPTLKNHDPNYVEPENIMHYSLMSIPELNYEEPYEDNSNESNIENEVVSTTDNTDNANSTNNENVTDENVVNNTENKQTNSVTNESEKEEKKEQNETQNELTNNITTKQNEIEENLPEENIETTE